MSASFHGRDLYAPAAAMVRKNDILGKKTPWEDRHGWPDDLNEIIYIDHFGNCMTGLGAEALDDINRIQVSGLTIPFAHTFSSVPSGDAFWYRNSQGLVEIAVNGGSVAAQLNLGIGTQLVI